MAVGTVSGINEDSYQLIATNTTTSGSTTTFSSLDSYKKLILSWQGVTQSAGPMLMTFNSSTSTQAVHYILKYRHNRALNKCNLLKIAMKSKLSCSECASGKSISNVLQVSESNRLDCAKIGHGGKNWQ